ncbi:MAG TPA: PDZ domain-containing protein, partial [Gemmatirosa sp.]|nr:PDZ domain-containing protein [Gemmatirosa sp.]
GEAPGERTVAAAPSTTTSRAPTARLGIAVAGIGELAQAQRTQLRVPADVQGVLVTDVDPSGPAARLLQRGDVIAAVLGAGGTRTAVTTAEQLRDAVGRSRTGVASLLVAGPSGQTRVANVLLRE